VLLMRQPYGRAIASTVTYAHPHWYASRGYAVVVQDVRGRGASGGRFGGFAQEAQDGGTAVAWARTLPYANSRLGTYGFSYQGLTQLLHASPPSGGDASLPDCTAPAMTGPDERRDWACAGGAHRWALGVGWALQLAAETARRRDDAPAWQEIRAALETGSFLRTGIDLLERHDPGGMGLGWLRLDPAVAAGWTVHTVPEPILRRPILLLGGWLDPHLEGVLDLQARSLAAGGTPLLRIGAWSHLDWAGGADRLQLAFFDHHLRDRDPPRLLPTWRAEDLTTGLWHPGPPEPAAPLRWGLRSSGLAAVDANEGQLLAGDGGDGELWLVHDPWRPVPGRGGHLGLDAGLVRREDLDRRADVACFTTPPLAGDLQLGGRASLELEVAADQPGFDLCAALSVVRGEEVRQLGTGVARFLGHDCLRRGRRRVVFQPLLATLRAGERLRLSLAGAAWPQIGVNPGTAELPAGPAGAAHRVITLQFHLGGSLLSLNPLASAKLSRSQMPSP
jgi:putative CocE/NonD family hydrolase